MYSPLLSGLIFKVSLLCFSNSIFIIILEQLHCSGGFVCGRLRICHGRRHWSHYAQMSEPGPFKCIALCQCVFRLSQSLFASQSPVDLVGHQLIDDQAKSCTAATSIQGSALHPELNSNSLVTQLKMQ